MNTYRITTSTKTKEVQASTMLLACAKFKATCRDEIIKAVKVGNLR